MIHVKIILLCVIGFIATHAVGARHTCTEGCKIPLGHYTDLGCTPVYSEDGKCCPKRFECPFMHRTVSDDNCYYKNKTYNVGDNLASDVISHTCTGSCFCDVGYDKKAKLICSQYGCASPPSVMTPDGPLICVHQYAVGGCCIGGTVCGSKEIGKLSTCTWDNQMYKEGERFYPKNMCKQCVCTKEFDNTVNGPWCRDISCGIELYNNNYIVSKCAPIYREETGCCPVYWKCSHKDDIIIRSKSSKNSDPQMQCHFENQKFNIGDQLMRDDRCVKCTCKVPPLMSCTADPDC